MWMLAAASTLKALAEPMRWRIVELLADEELCVCHLVEDLGVPQPLVSHHLRVLRDAGLVESERYRYWTYYRLRPRAARRRSAARSPTSPSRALPAATGAAVLLSR